MFSTKEHFFQLVGIYKEARSQINYENNHILEFYNQNENHFIDIFTKFPSNVFL